MLNRIAILSLVALAATGCTTGYRVRVNGYSELDKPLASTATLFVATDPNSPNRIFDGQIKANIETLLQGYGYRVAEAATDAVYCLRFRIGTRSETVTGYAPTYHPAFGPRGGYPDRPHIGFHTYPTPYYDTVHDQWLTLRLSRTDTDGAEALVWIGEATLTTERADLRATIGYLLVAAIDQLGVDTGRNITVGISRNDPRLLDISTP